MVEICTWDEVFTKYTKKENISLVILYWYLFNKPDHQKNIATVMGNLREKDEFKEIIPSYLAYPNNIGSCLRKMEEHNLVGIEKIKNRKRIYQALSFFYLDPFCLKTPESIKVDIRTHHEEYINYVKGFNKQKAGWIDSEKSRFVGDTYWPFQAFSFRKDNSVIPAQKIFQYYSPEPEEFMKWISYEKIDYVVLYELIRDCFSDISTLCGSRKAWIDEEDNFWNLMEEDDIEGADYLKNDFLAEYIGPVKMLQWKKAGDIIDHMTVELIYRYGVVDWFGSDLKEKLLYLETFDTEERFVGDYLETTERECWDILRSHASTMKYCVDKQLKLYQHIKRGNISFNRETLMFE
ncbi:MAG: hypothetical protein AYK19_01590 [Theionarchaea archaeon DG-70-1]|nr:MAG: hypothetical protein AYK19_01590 [Theionarchaea archaeon DG-70-1]